MLRFSDGRIVAGERGSSLYPERRDEEPGKADRWLIENYGRVAALFERGAPRLRRQAEIIEELGKKLLSASDDALRQEAARLRAALRREGFTIDLVNETFALVRETAARRVGMRPYQVQLMGGLALMQGRLAEMQTGEGKTLTASLAAATAALGGWPTHVVTVNDYLAERDAEELRPLYEALGLSVGFVKQGQEPPQRRAAYACDVTYAVNKEVAFDYQRDRLAMGRRRLQSNAMVDRIGRAEAGGPSLLLRGLHFAIVDEADSIMIDEARTPLIIAGAGDADEQSIYATALNVADQLVAGADFELIAANRHARLTDEGGRKTRALTEGFGGLWEARRGREEMVSQALAAKRLYARDVDYVVVDGKVQIVDAFTGRIADGRQWQNGLHQLIEMKEGVEITARTATQSSITYQRFFRRYLHLAGMSGTLAETVGELRAVYGLKVVRIPKNRPNRRIDRGAKLFGDADAKRAAIAESAQALQAEGRPVLIGTGSVAESEATSRALNATGIAHVLLNARNDSEEAGIVAQAGQTGRITVATSMAGRGTDIKLTPEARAAGGLHVILTQYAESKRVDRQLVGRAGRQGDPASCEALVAFDDDMFRLHASGFARWLRRALRGKGPFPAFWAERLRRAAQSRAEKLAAQARRDTLNRQREFDKQLGFAGRE
ncbi:prepilin peptidase [Terrarubrum flagellatum]|uniref:preprotein translocase subunit SecA n=1 Tax=Terrirubrum flagellatum TaxID=2895980 RepID=UPI003144FD2E